MIKDQKLDIYSQDGVNVALGDLASSFAAKQCVKTYSNSSIANVLDLSNGNFRGPRSVQLKSGYDCTGTGKYSLSCAPDGIGTKVVLHDSAKSWGVAAFDLVAMTSFDLVRWGGKPVYFTSVLDVKTLGNNVSSETFKAVKKLYKGMRKAATAVQMIVLNGETAELASTVTSENPNAILNYNWGGSAQGLFHQDRMILGNTLRPGQIVMLLKENGFRSNGISSVRKALVRKFGEKWYLKKEAMQYIKMAAQHSVLYDAFFCAINGWDNLTPNIKVHLLVHLSGGSFESKLGHDLLFPQGLSANLKHLYEPPEIMKKCAEWRGMDCTSIYKTWNGGQGALAIIDRNKEDIFVKTAAQFGLDAKRGGVIERKSTPRVKIRSAFSGEKIVFT